MTMETFKKAIDLAVEYGDTVSIGGGEPTVHPLFWDMLGYAIVKLAEIDVIPWLATNGKKTNDALRLATLAKRGVIFCELSQDDYHEPIDDMVVKAFKVSPKTYLERQDDRDYRGVRNTTQDGQEPIKAGRCDWGYEECICEDIFVKPNGDIHQCGCAKSPKIGNVKTGLKSHQASMCYKNIVDIHDK